MRLTTVALLLVLAACKRSGGEADLPPASGAGAAPLPQLPKLEPASAAGGTTVAATQDKATGELAAHERAEVGPTVSGILTTVSVREGDRVKKGDPLFKTDARDAWLRYQQAQAALEAATVNEQAVKTEYDRTKYLFEQNAANRAQWEQIQARYDGAKVAVRQAKVALSMAGKSVGDASVRSPIAGVVTKKLKNAGEMVTTMPPSPVVVVEQLDPIDLHVHLPERALARIKRGDKLTATFEVIAEIPNPAAPDHKLTSGLLATVKLP